jgi:hypothetical protein
MICSAVSLMRFMVKSKAQPGRLMTLIYPGPNSRVHVTEILLALLQCASKVALQHTKSWCLFWVRHGIECQYRQAQGDILKSQQGIGEGLRGEGT